MNEALLPIAALFQSAAGEGCVIQAREDRCFKEAEYFSLGTIHLGNEKADSPDVLSAVRHGAFEWRVPTSTAAHDDLVRLLGLTVADKADKNKLEVQLDRLPRILASIATLAVRLGLVHPRFDASFVQELPITRPLTVVPDTSGVLQGGLSFASSFLHPFVRFALPPIVHMEILNQTDRYFTQRRAAKLRPASTLHDHLTSQGGHRALLRLELDTDTDIQRHHLFGDPLRPAFIQDKETGLVELNLSVPVRNYCDRLILEAARKHQSYVSYGHSIRLLTSDQGLARMALAEGIDPIYFSAVRADDFFGRTLTGANFGPLDGRVYRTSIAELLWEVATSFGGVRLTSTDYKNWIELIAIGSGLDWAPYHSKSDLLWLNFTSPTGASTTGGKKRRGSSSQSRSLSVGPGDSADTRPASIGFYKFKVDSLLAITRHLVERVAAPEAEVKRLIGVPTESGISEYRNFLQSGGFIQIVDDRWEATERLHQFWIAATTGDLDELARILLGVPSFSQFRDALEAQRVLREKDKAVPIRAFSTYSVLAQISGLAAAVEGEGLYPTPQKPSPEQFAVSALEVFNAVAKGERFASTGAWLEELIRKGIHPVLARKRLEEARARAILTRLTEGSTADTRFDKHTLRVLDQADGRPQIDTIYLYRGDFLLPDKSSTSLRIEATQK